MFRDQSRHAKRSISSMLDTYVQLPLRKRKCLLPLSCRRTLRIHLHPRRVSSAFMVYISERHDGRLRAKLSRESAQIPNFSEKGFSLPLKRLRWTPTDYFPDDCLPYRSCFPSHASGVRQMCPRPSNLISLQRCVD